MLVFLDGGYPNLNHGQFCAELSVCGRITVRNSRATLCLYGTLLSRKSIHCGSIFPYLQFIVSRISLSFTEYILTNLTQYFGESDRAFILANKHSHVNKAAVGLLRLQETYSLPINDLAQVLPINHIPVPPISSNWMLRISTMNN